MNVDDKLKAANAVFWRLSSCYQLRDGRYTVYLTFNSPTNIRHYASQTGSGATLTEAFDSAWRNVEMLNDLLSYKQTEDLTAAIDRLTTAVKNGRT